MKVMVGKMKITMKYECMPTPVLNISKSIALMCFNS
jgi:hypothetical protein